MDIWSGLATELMGAWVVARVVEFAIRRNSEFDKVRVRTARNLRYYSNISNRLIEFDHRPDLLLIQKEQKWSKSFYTQHENCFSQDEIDDLDNSYAALDRLITELVSRDKTNEELSELLEQYETIALKAEKNIFEETPEIL
ncbi:hypothetical protein [Pseudoalteromonas sp. SR41-7]|uniref:hypothetical protein n=1 Tax=Pseudoalteromonas sp. SR41-7 TaxID=2760947 RepID=UPI001602C625|nr:hypothetical protein [Pseudoalteromonas sp. SR41-7]MBB1296712.1 hypothetical protein [Pseudoalteromonas sp. SR41-7]